MLIHDVNWYFFRRPGLLARVGSEPPQEQWLSLKAVLQGRKLLTNSNVVLFLCSFEPARKDTSKPIGDECSSVEEVVLCSLCFEPV